MTRRDLFKNAGALAAITSGVGLAKLVAPKPVVETRGKAVIEVWRPTELPTSESATKLLRDFSMGACFWNLKDNFLKIQNLKDLCPICSPLFSNHYATTSCIGHGFEKLTDAIYAEGIDPGVTNHVVIREYCKLLEVYAWKGPIQIPAALHIPRNRFIGDGWILHRNDRVSWRFGGANNAVFVVESLNAT